MPVQAVNSYVLGMFYYIKRCHDQANYYKRKHLI